MMRRRRPLMRAAMVGGVAYHAGKRTQQGREREEEQEARLQELEAQQAYAPAPAPAAAPAPAGPDMIQQLTKLGELRTAGILTEEEFAAQKAKILQAT
jgi:hypothetical protein